MNIISGPARGVELCVPEGIPVRPTTGRARKALFDSLGDLTGTNVLDLFSGSGALALESLSRNACSAAMVELELRHVRIIEENLRRVRGAGVTAPAWIIQADALNCAGYLSRLKTVPDLIFADPPYPISAKSFAALLADDFFCKVLAGSTLIWEIPDHPGAAGEFITAAKRLDRMNLRRFAGTMFISGEIRYDG